MLKVRHFAVALLWTFCIPTQAQNWTQTQDLNPAAASTSIARGSYIDMSSKFAIMTAWNSDAIDGNGNVVSKGGAAVIFQRANNGLWSEMQTIYTSDPIVDGFAVTSVAVSDSFAVIGAKRERRDAMGNNPINLAGAAYIYKLDNQNNWNFIQKITASDRNIVGFFGNALAIHENTLVVASHTRRFIDAQNNTIGAAGAVYVFQKNSQGQWIEEAKLVANNPAVGDFFGESVDYDGGHIIVGAVGRKVLDQNQNLVNDAGAAFLFEKQNGTWVETQEINSTQPILGDYMGNDVHIKGNRAVVGAPQFTDYLGIGGGVVHVLEADQAGVWTETAVLDPGFTNDAAFGAGVNLEGDRIFVGASEQDLGQNPTIPDAGTVYFYELQGGNWVITDTFEPEQPGTSDFFGLELAVHNGVVLVAAPLKDAILGNFIAGSAGLVYVFEQCLAQQTSMNTKICLGDSVFVGGNFQKTSGIYTDSLVTVIGCDSVIVTDLTVTSIDTTTSTQGTSISSNMSNANYQWIDCSTGLEVSGETAASFTPSATGSYAVVVSDGPCSDTSACTDILINSIDENHVFERLQLFPNPGKNLLTINASSPIQRIVVMNGQGQRLVDTDPATSSFTLQTDEWPTGLYFIQLTNENGFANRTWIKLDNGIR